MRVLLWFAFAVPATCLDRACNPRKQHLFTGYKVEAQINLALQETEFYLYHCHDDNVVSKTSLGNTIPWTQPILTVGEQHIILSRRKTFALRPLPLFYPMTLVGALYYESDDNDTGHLSMPLVAEDIFDYWTGVDSQFAVTFHVPILTSLIQTVPNKWDRYISISETYTFDSECRVWYRILVDKFLTKVLAQPNRHEAAREMYALLWKMVAFSKVLLRKAFSKLLAQLDTWSVD